MSEDELGENMPPEGDWNGDSTIPDCVNAVQPVKRFFSLKRVSQNQFIYVRKLFALHLYLIFTFFFVFLIFMMESAHNSLVIIIVIKLLKTNRDKCRL